MSNALIIHQKELNGSIAIQLTNAVRQSSSLTRDLSNNTCPPNQPDSRINKITGPLS